MGNSLREPQGEPLELRATHTDRTPAAVLPGFSVVGLGGVLARAPYRARAGSAPGSAVSRGFRWRLTDEWTGRWWPQGIAVGEYEGIPLALVSWYAQPRRGVRQGARITVVDLRDRDRPRYRHVLLVEQRDSDAGVVLDPVLAHAGGIAWSGDRLLVAATFDGIREFRLGDILRSGHGTRGPFGYDFVLPQHGHHRAVEPHAKDRMRYSFLTVESGDEAGPATDDAGLLHLPLVAGEYHRDDAHRIARLMMSGERTLVRETHVPEIARMQGVALHDGTWFVSASRGERRGGDLWSGPIDALQQHEGVLPPGPEALAVWPERGELWSVSEIRGHRWLYSMKLADLA